MSEFDAIYFKIIVSGMLLPLLFSLCIWKVYMHKINILDNLGASFYRSIKNAFYLSICSIVVSSIALYLLYDNKTETGVLLVLNLTIAISVGLSSLLVRNLLVYLYVRYPHVFEKKYDQEKVDRIVRYGVNAGYAAVVGIMLVVVNEFFHI